ncbi:hypothetical protein PN925_002928 [Morganella morganii]|uniref:Uncharacterized protein n=1 Tax=Morganella morganii TaxID=582 RepID=A0AAI9HTQ7_MORMO|nr:hypothetical protein [Morganella morganii]HCE8950071.1 hypothetical protein [Morganella morganii]
METKSKGIFSKLIDIADKSDADINISFVSHQDVQLDIIKKDIKSSETKEKDNKELTLLLSDIKAGFQQTGIPLNMTQGNGEKKENVITAQKSGKASLSEAEVALQKMQLQAQALGAELVLTDRPAVMAEERWALPEISPQEFRAADLPAGEGLAKLAAAIKAVTDKYPLQIALMIRPDFRPQVMLNVSAGEVNWIFAAKEGRYPLKDVLAKMAGKTVTHGWDAIVVYQRGQANNLLQQQHIKRFTTGNTLAPVNGDIESSTATRLLTHNLTLSAPHLSFNKAGSGDSTAQVAMDFVKGMIVYKEKAVDGSYRIMRIEKITPLNSPYVAMDVPLSKAPGSVSEIGEVQFDIKEGDHFTNNLVLNGMEQETISNFFKRRFVATPAEQRIYKLGTISNYEHEQFQPEDFVIRTMGAPNTASRGSQDEGDGAVVLFVQVKNGSQEPGKTEVDWLLGDDYSSALVVSSCQLFDKMIRKPSEITLGYNLTFDRHSDGAGKACKLKAASGIIGENFSFTISHPWSPSDIYGRFECLIYTDLHNKKIKDVSLPFSIGSSYSGGDKYDICSEYKFDGHIGSIYSGNEVRAAGYRYIYDEHGHIENPQIDADGYYSLHLYFKAVYNAVINDGVISFVYSPDESSYSLTMDNNVCVSGCDKIKLSTVDNISKEYRQEICNKIVDKIKVSSVNIKLSDINTFSLRNLLFPADNYFRVQYARVPGDLLVMGKLGAGSESFAVTPTETTIVAGSVYQFTTTPEVSGVKWRISDSEKGNTNVDLGHIDAATGKYTAPQAATVTEGVRHVVVCAEKGDTKVYALASVIAKGVSVSPAYQVVQPGKEIKLAANSVNGGELKWDMGANKQGSSLTKVTNNEYTYKAGKKVAKLNLNLERVTVTDEKGASGEALILIPNSTMAGKVTVSYDNVPADSVKLIYTVVIQVPKLDENGDQIYDEDDNPEFDEKEVELTGSQANWTAVETGGATFDKKTGILTSAPGVGDGFAVIRVAYTKDTTQYRSAIVIPLPLSTYKKTILEAYSPEQ